MTLIMQNTLADLKKFTADCRPDMHEPDEQGLSASVVGTRLDNAFGTMIEGSCLDGNFQESVVILHKADGTSRRFNLATLIALARAADLEKM